MKDPRELLNQGNPDRARFRSMGSEEINQALKAEYGLHDKKDTSRSYGNAEDYLKYADGNPLDKLFEFKEMSQHWHYNDYCTWEAIRNEIRNHDLATVVDIGCGAGTWAVRMAVEFPGLQVDGYDISEGQIRLANETLDKHAAVKGREDIKKRVRFKVGDAAEVSASEPYDMSICLHDILNHIEDYGAAIDGMKKTARRHITSVHTVHGPRTFYATDPENVPDSGWVKLGDWLLYTDKRGKFFAFHDHLFSLSEIVDAYEGRDLQAIDAFGVDIGVSVRLHAFQKNNPKLNPLDILPFLRTTEEMEKRMEPMANYGEHIIVISKTGD